MLTFLVGAFSCMFLILPQTSFAVDKLLQESDLTYLGAFRVPGGQYGCSTDEQCSFHFS